MVRHAHLSRNEVVTEKKGKFMNEQGFIYNITFASFINLNYSK